MITGAAALSWVIASAPASAAEGGASLYVPGLGVPLAGILPPPGVYFDNTTWFYQGELKGRRQLQIGGNVVADVKADIKADFVTGLWVMPTELLGGNAAFSLTVPFGEPKVSAGAVISGPIIKQLLGRPLVLGVSDATFNFGDPILTGLIGWHSGNWHWKLGAAASIPAGGYEPGQLSNVALNRWVADFTAGATYLDPQTGIDLSVVGGFTTNGENPSTRYRTGDEFHLDVSLSKNLTKGLSVGVIASHYQQVTGDSGPGAKLGAFKGRDTAIGGTIGYTDVVGRIPVSMRLRVLREVEVENRLQGTIGWLQISFPLWMGPQAAPPPVAGRS